MAAATVTPLSITDARIHARILVIGVTCLTGLLARHDVTPNPAGVGVPAVGNDGCFTLTSGIFSRQPAPGGSALAMVNGGLESFARAAALEMPRRIRVNVVSPPWVSETMIAMGLDPSGGLPAAVVAR